jgi:hypothetical protein
MKYLETYQQVFEKTRSQKIDFVQHIIDKYAPWYKISKVETPIYREELILMVMIL